MNHSVQKFSLGVAVVVVGVLLAAISSAQCVSCTGPGGPGQVCITSATGWSSCYTSPDPDIGCKLSCPNCPAQGCSGGGGGDCDPGGFSVMPITGDDAVITTQLIFKTSAAASMQLFGGRPGAYRVLTGAATGSFEARAAQDIVSRELHEPSPLLAFAATNVNDGGVPAIVATRNGESFAFAPRGQGMSSQVEFRVRGAGQPARAVDRVSLTGNDVLLVSLRVQGEFYVVVLRSEMVNRNAPDFSQRIERAQESLRQSFFGLPRGPRPSIFIIPVC